MSGVDEPARVGRPPAGEEGGTVITRSEEELRVGSTWRPRERVRLHKRVVTETRTYTVELRREELVIEREPASGTEGVQAEAGADDGLLEIVLHEEEVVVEKRVVPRERVRVRKERITEERPVTAELRREEIDVESDAAVRGPAT